MPHPQHLPPSLARSALIALAALALPLALLLAGCSSDADQSAATTSSTLLPIPAGEAVPVVTVPDGFVVPDTRNATLLPFEWRSRGPGSLAITGGSSRLTGTVSGPDGPAAGATVRVDRVVGSRVASLSTTTDAEGRFSADGLLGGAYRARAWLAPSLTTTDAAVAFLAAEAGSASVEIQMERFEGTELQAVLDQAGWNVGDKATLRALLTRQTVNDNGVVVGEGLSASEIRLAAGAGLVVGGDAVATTNASGIATWALTCDTEGSHPVTLTTTVPVVGTVSASPSLPSCGPRPTTTTTTTPGGSLPSDLPPFAVGDEFTVPRSAPVPAGTYRTFLAGCVTTYQLWVDGKWQSERSQTAGDMIALSAPARDFQPGPATDGCRFRRVA